MLRVLAAAAGLGCGDLAARLGLGNGGDPDSRIVWKYSEAAESITPAIDDSTVFFATVTRGVRAVDKRSGALRWAATSGRSGFSPGTALLVVGGVVVYPDADLFAFDRRTGAVRWVFRDLPTGSPGYTSLATDGVRVFAGSGSGDAFAIDPTDGHLVWKTRIATDSTQTVVADPVVDAGLVVVTYSRPGGVATGGICGLDAVTGAIRWRRELTPAAAGQPSGGYRRAAVTSTLVVVSSADGRTFGLDRGTGSITWVTTRDARLGAFQGDWRPVVVAGDVAVVGSSGFGTLAGLEVATGAERWQIDPKRGSFLDLMTVADGVIYLAFLPGELAALDPQTGQLLWQTPSGTANTYWTYPAVDATRLFASGVAGLYALRR
ncbi:MAG: PQQ-binding-like beta-propeller repeat protein [Gemmatimonadetes bacterium]|nr:PQQ-binding-like beta-propeller repeat protein [Gemmatimonadota bacterium]